MVLEHLYQRVSKAQHRQVVHLDMLDESITSYSWSFKWTSNLRFFALLCTVANAHFTILIIKIA